MSEFASGFKGTSVVLWGSVNLDNKVQMLTKYTMLDAPIKAIVVYNSFTLIRSRLKKAKPD